MEDEGESGIYWNEQTQRWETPSPPQEESWEGEQQPNVGRDAFHNAESKMVDALPGAVESTINTTRRGLQDAPERFGQIGNAIAEGVQRTLPKATEPIKLQTPANSHFSSIGTPAVTFSPPPMPRGVDTFLMGVMIYWIIVIVVVLSWIGTRITLAMLISWHAFKTQRSGYGWLFLAFFGGTFATLTYMATAHRPPTTQRVEQSAVPKRFG